MSEDDAAVLACSRAVTFTEEMVYACQRGKRNLTLKTALILAVVKRLTEDGTCTRTIQVARLQRETFHLVNTKTIVSILLWLEDRNYVRLLDAPGVDRVDVRTRPCYPSTFICIGYFWPGVLCHEADPDERGGQ